MLECLARGTIACIAVIISPAREPKTAHKAYSGWHTYPSEYLALIVLSAPAENITYEESNQPTRLKTKISEVTILVGK